MANIAGTHVYQGGLLIHFASQRNGRTLALQHSCNPGMGYAFGLATVHSPRLGSSIQVGNPLGIKRVVEVTNLSGVEPIYKEILTI